MLQRAGTRPLAERIAEIEREQAGPFGVNFVPALGQGDPQEVELAPRARASWSSSGPSPSRGWSSGCTLAARSPAGRSARSRKEALPTAGCDLVVAQGVEAGGHVRGTVALLPLLAGVLDAVSVPVVAARIASARSMAAALAAGASAVRIGTRFLATPESGAHPTM